MIKRRLHRPKNPKSHTRSETSKENLIDNIVSVSANVYQKMLDELKNYTIARDAVLSSGGSPALLNKIIKRYENHVSRLKMLVDDANVLRSKFRTFIGYRPGQERWRGNVWIYKPYLAMLRELERAAQESPGAIVPHHVLAQAGRAAFESMPKDELKGRKPPSECDRSYAENGVRSLRRIYDPACPQNGPLISIQSVSDIIKAGGELSPDVKSGHRMTPLDPALPATMLAPKNIVVNINGKSQLTILD